MGAHLDTRLLKVSRNIEENGGKVVDLDDPKLTHVVFDKRDVSRRVTLIQRTSKYVASLCGSTKLILLT